VDELRHLAYIVANITQKEARVKLQKELEERRLLQAESAESLALEEVVMVREMPDLAVHVEKLIVRITNTVKSDPEVWDILAEFQHTLGRFDLELEARIKQVWCLLSAASFYLFFHKNNCFLFSVSLLDRGAQLGKVRSKVGGDARGAGAAHRGALLQGRQEVGLVRMQVAAAVGVAQDGGQLQGQRRRRGGARHDRHRGGEVPGVCLSGVYGYVWFIRNPLHNKLFTK
jgi:hypothetical protein